MADPRSFQTDLNQLTDAADVRLPHLNDLLHAQLDAFNKYAGLNIPPMCSNADSAFLTLIGILRDRVQKASGVVEATSAALHDIAVCYARADGRR